MPPSATDRLNVPQQQGGFTVPGGSAGQQPGNWKPNPLSGLLVPAPTSRSPQDPYGVNLVPQAQWDQMTQALGYDAKQAYISYRQNFQSTAAQPTPLGGGGGNAAAEDASSWIYAEEQHVYGQFAPVVELRAQQWAQANGQPMPVELRNQEIAALKNAPASVTDALMSSLMTYQAPRPTVDAMSPAIKAKIIGALTGTLPKVMDGAVTNFVEAWYVQKYGQAAVDTAIAGADPSYKKWLTDHQTAGGAIAGKTSTGASSMPFLDTIESDYSTAHPLAMDEQAAANQRLVSSFSVLGRPPTSQEEQQLQHSSPEQIQAYIDAQPLPGTGMTYGTHSTLFNANQKQWQQYFGHDPTTADLRAIAGMSPEQVTAYINGSPSKSVPGATIGQATDYTNMWTKAQKDLGGSEVSAWMLQQIHGAVQGKPSGPMAPNGVNAAPAVTP